MMVKFAGEFVTVLGTGEQFQHPFPSCFRYEGLDKSEFVGVHACTVTPQTEATTHWCVEIRRQCNIAPSARLSAIGILSVTDVTRPAREFAYHCRMFNFGKPKTAGDWIVHIAEAIVAIFLVCGCFGCSYSERFKTPPAWSTSAVEILQQQPIPSNRFLWFFPETQGSVLNVFLFQQPYTVERFVIRRRTSYSSMQGLTDALTKAGLPGKEISSVVQPQALNTLKTYAVTSTQVEMLELTVPEYSVFGEQA
jgi:hypothetical protein